MIEEKKARGKVEVYNTQTVYTTTDYDMFKAFKAQPRHRAEKNMKTLKASMIKFKGNIEPITVNSDFEIVDGNTRWLTAKTFNLKLSFIIRENNVISDAEFMREVNIAQKQMTLLELIESMSKMDSAAYKGYRDLHTFMEDIDEIFTVAMLAKLEPRLSAPNIRSGEIGVIDYRRLRVRVRIVTEIYKSFGNLDISPSALCSALAILMKNTKVQPMRLVAKIHTHGDSTFKLMRVNKITDIPNMKKFIEIVYNKSSRKRDKVDVFEEFIKGK